MFILMLDWYIFSVVATQTRERWTTGSRFAFRRGRQVGQYLPRSSRVLDAVLLVTSSQYTYITITTISFVTIHTCS